MFTPLALTVSFSLLASLIVEVTGVPNPITKLLSKASKDVRRYLFYTLHGKKPDFYKAILDKVLKFRKTSVFVTLVLIAGSIAATPFIGAEFIPAGDQGQLDIKVETRASSSLAAT